MNEQLKDCPFCGCDASILIILERHEFDKFKVMCRNPECKMQSAHYISDIDATIAWNKRVRCMEC